MKLPRLAFVFCGLLLLFAGASQAVDFCNGEMLAVPVKDGQAPTIDGDLSDWDLSAAEPLYIAAQSAAAMHAEWAVMYDDEALYIATTAAMPGRPYSNVNNPQDAFWSGDLPQVRLSSDPDLPYPLNGDRDRESNRVCHISVWKNTETDTAYLHIAYGTRFNRSSVVNPEGSALVIVTDSDRGYTAEMRIPWSALNVPGGKNPFKPGQAAAFVAETLWIGGDTSRTLLCYNTNPGVFAFNQPSTWGRLRFAAESPGRRIRPTMEQILADVRAELARQPAKVGVPFEVNVPDDGLKVSVNIVRQSGAVIREVMGGEAHPRGRLTVYWDGRDAFGKPVPAGEYHWAAYFHKGLKAVYQGGVGSSGNPFYNTMDGKGGWGGDHSHPVDVVADAEAFYLLWHVAEAGCSVVKIDRTGNVLWRKRPFVGGGYGPYYSFAVNDQYVFLARGNDTSVCRLLKTTGALTVWDPTTREDEIALAEKNGGPGPGMVATSDRVYVSSYGAGQIIVFDPETGGVLNRLACPGPRGLALGPDGELYAVSVVPGQPAGVLRFATATGEGRVVVTDLVAPHGIAVDAQEQIYVSDAGAAQQIKVFNSEGGLLKTIGEAGGRPWQGAYDPDAMRFLEPSGLALDGQGGLLVAESSPPKVFSRIRLSDGKLLQRWYGPGVYWNSTWPMPDDPRNVFYMLNHAVGRARLGTPDQPGVPNAYWNLVQSGYPHAGNLEALIPQPETIIADNGVTYFVQDTAQHVICVLENDLMRPIATWLPVDRDEQGKWLNQSYMTAWIDRNGDGQPQDDEIVRWDKLADGTPIPRIASSTSSMHMQPNGDLYFTTFDNCLVKVPAAGFGQDGLIEWDIDQAYKVVPRIMPGLDAMFNTWRTGPRGVRVDTSGHLYTVFNVALKGGTGEYDYADQATAKRMREGMGHTASFNVVKMAKYTPRGELIWMAGRKATAGAAPGEMYHFWNIAGLVNDKYIAGASEWGQIYFYTHDGFFVDALMNNPGAVNPPGPYTFGGETSGGRVAFFEESGELWAYSSGMAYRVEGFSNGAVEGESRAAGTVVLDKVYDLAAAAEATAGPLQIVRLDGTPMTDVNAWTAVPVATLRHNGQPLASAQFGYDADFFYARIAVVDDSPLENGETDDKLAFKGGDTAGIALGPQRPDGQPGPGDVRFMAAQLDGAPRLIAMKTVTQGVKRPEFYETPATGRVAFDFVGQVPGGNVNLEKTADGYLATFAVPRNFLEFDLAKDVLQGDVEVRLSGAGQRGLQATSRNYLFSPRNAHTTMVDDVPTEARLYPEYWGEVEVKP